MSRVYKPGQASRQRGYGASVRISHGEQEAHHDVATLEAAQV
jgi:hypothetical protein